MAERAVIWLFICSENITLGNDLLARLSSISRKSLKREWANIVTLIKITNTLTNAIANTLLNEMRAFVVLTGLLVAGRCLFMNIYQSRI